MNEDKYNRKNMKIVQSNFTPGVEAAEFRKILI
jgi:hypothetical protein